MDVYLSDPLTQAYDLLDALGGIEGGDEAALSQALPQPRPSDRQPATKPAPRPKPKPKPATAVEHVYQPPRVIIPQELLRGTRFCRYVAEGQRCPNGPNCDFAHDEKTLEECKAAARRYMAGKRAEMGWAPPPRPGREERARARDDRGPVPSAGSARFKTQLCLHWMRHHRECSYGDRCSFAHGEAELRRHLGNEEAVQRELAQYSQASAVPSAVAPARTSRPIAAGVTMQAPPPGPKASPPGPSQQTTGNGPGPHAMSAEQLAELYARTTLSDDEDEHMPEAFMCPITQVRLKDPVVAADGYSYERSAIEAWLSNKDTSPLTNLPLTDKVLVPNLTLMAAMRVVLGDGCFS